MNEIRQQVFLDTDLSIRQVRHSALHLWLGQESDGEEASAKLFQDLFGGEVRAMSEAVLSNAKTVFRERMFLRENGEPLWVRLTLEPWLRKRRVVGVVATLENIDQQKGQLLQAGLWDQIRHVSLLSRHLSSRLCHPLAGMANRINALLLVPETAVFGQELRELQARILDLLHLCEKLEGLVIDARLHNQRVDVGHTLQKAVDVASMIFPHAGVRFDLEAPPLASRMSGNEVTLEQCFLHILRNAVESMPQGGTISIRHQLDVLSNIQQIAVKDQGGGMSEQEVVRACEPFYTTKKGEHLGIGLSISYAIVMVHHGSIKINSVLGQGTTVTLSLPLEQGHLSTRTTHGKSKS